eukprot:CAMPEP_0183374950 /NCGR_PEP_ID=MMETSP0164_2-20130417/115929_1 /TAXON_ID=221442 /ORGANISM="Coccolithus pelagicus ssp braarudi, Strain PLY182g" /LENGTH=32 /DNA_ID= /DNA_START= /DNA_END= /DNA_ORIENTATION=
MCADCVMHADPALDGDGRVGRCLCAPVCELSN